MNFLHQIDMKKRKNNDVWNEKIQSSYYIILLNCSRDILVVHALKKLGLKPVKTGEKKRNKNNF